MHFLHWAADSHPPTHGHNAMNDIVSMQFPVTEVHLHQFIHNEYVSFVPVDIKLNVQS